VKASASGLGGRSSKSVLPFATRLAILFFASYTGFAQTDAPVPAAAAGVLLVKLSAPVYPRLARQARIMGDVRIQLAIRRDGIESSAVVSGHPLLKHAALESAQLSGFECRGCSDEVNSYSLNYRFGLRDDNACRPVVDKRRVRSLKMPIFMQVRCAADLHLAATDQYGSRSDSLSESCDDSCVYGVCGNLIFLLTVRAIRERAFSHCSQPII
jgi:hypothetical protein